MKDKIYHYCAFAQKDNRMLFIDGWVIFNKPINENYDELKELLRSVFEETVGKFTILSLSLIEGGHP
jgi:hypothetical protein